MPTTTPTLETTESVTDIETTRIDLITEGPKSSTSNQK